MKKIIVILLFILSASFSLTASPVVKAVIEKEVYDVGDVIKVKINIESNPGFHSLFFDLEYDGSILVPDNLDEGLMVRREFREHSFLHAFSDPVTSSTSGSHVIVSYALKGTGAQTMETGNLAEIYFRVVDRGVEDTLYNFTFNTYEVVDGTGGALSSDIWTGSNDFLLGTAVSNAYVVISSPYGNQVVYDESVELSGVNSPGAGYTLRIENLENGYISPDIDVSSGSFSNISVPLALYNNNITVILSDALGNRLAVDTVLAYRSDQKDYINIAYPLDHSLLNRDKVSVKVVSNSPGVVINGSAAVPDTILIGGRNVYSRDVWLKDGFNTLTAQVDVNGVIYSDAITVYFQKNDSLFSILTPIDGASLEPGTQLTVTGETARSSDNVTIEGIFRPRSEYYGTREFKEVAAEVSENDGIPGTTSSYIFTARIPMNLSDLPPGTLEIIAYKNKEGQSFEQAAHRVIYIDSNTLCIELVQPRISGIDMLDSQLQLDIFDVDEADSFSSMAINEAGEFTLIPDQGIGEEVSAFSDKEVTDLIETPRGDLYALVNNTEAGYRIEIYKKGYDDEEWGEPVFTGSNLYGYDICYTDRGVMAGVSNVGNNGNSGLYLLEETTDGESTVFNWINIQLGVPIPHVQFIEYRQGKVYLYGNDYSYLYAFSLFTMEEKEGDYHSEVVEAVPFDNDLFLKGFLLGEDLKTGALITDEGDVLIYQNLLGTGFTVNDSISLTDIESGRYAFYSQGGYSIFLFLEEGGETGVSIMENRSNGRLVVNSVAFPSGAGETILGVAGADEGFNVLVDTGAGYVVKKYLILFDRIMDLSKTEPFVYSGTIIPGSLTMLYSSLGTIYSGIGGDSGLCKLYRTFPSSGSARVFYENPTISAIKGFEFTADSRWINSDNAFIGFEVFGGDDSFSQSVVSLKELESLENSHFEVFREYDDGICEKIKVVFSREIPDSSIRFDIELSSLTGITPFIKALGVDTSFPVRFPQGEGDYILPVHGYVFDPTVSEVYIDTTSVPVGSDRSFSHSLTIPYGINSTTVVLRATNSSYERTEVSFDVQVVKSLNGLADTRFYQVDGGEITFPMGAPGEMDTNQLNISTRYYGLRGAVVGYELHSAPVPGENTLLSRGILETRRDSSFNSTSFEEISEDHELYESGTLASGTGIPLFPGTQYLLLYVENPGGKRVYYSQGDSAYPAFHYTLPAEEQCISITSEKTVPMTQEIVNSIPFNQFLKVEVNEQNSGGYSSFQRRIYLTGEVKSQEPFSNLKVKSFSGDCSFDDGSSEILIEVNERHQFSFALDINMPENTADEYYDIALIPTAPFLDWMKKGLRIHAVKDYSGARIIPDFSPMDPAVYPWNSDELKILEKKLVVQFDRYIPGGTRINLVVNFDQVNMITGELKLIDLGTGSYRVEEQNDEKFWVQQYLSGVKEGRNRIEWTLLYNNNVISSSRSGDPDMEDFFFTVPELMDYAPTEVTFNTNFQTYYNDSDNPVPDFILSKDPRTSVTLYLNDRKLPEDLNKSSGITITPARWSTYGLEEGVNTLVLKYRELGVTKEEQSLSYTFLYDSLAPVVKITGYEYNEDFTVLTGLKAQIREKNLKSLSLKEWNGSFDIKESTRVVHLIADDIYEVFWYQLDTLIPPLQPDASSSLVVEAADYSGKTGVSLEFTGVSGSSVWPEPVTAQALGSPPIYDPGNGYPLLENERTIVNSKFSGYMKFFNAHIILGPRTLGAGDSFVMENDDTISILPTPGPSGSPGIYLIEPDPTPGAFREVRIKAGNKVVLNSGFKVEQGASFKVEMDPELTVSEAYPFSYSTNSPEVSFGFYFRYEHESYYLPDGEFRRILTLYEDTEGSYYLAYKDSDPTAPGNVWLYLLHEDSSGNVNVIIDGESSIPLTDAGENDWDMIILSFQYNPAGENAVVRLSVNGSLEYSTVINDGTSMETITGVNTTAYFGEKDRSLSGYFAVARPFYANKVIDARSLLEIEEEIDPEYTVDYGPEEQRFYHFDDETEGFGDLHNQLRVNQAEDRDYIRFSENADYTSASGGGALKVSADHHNLLIRTDNGLIFNDASNPNVFNIQSSSALEGEDFYINVKDEKKIGRYYFANTFGSHNLKTDEWYSISGEVVSLAFSKQQDIAEEAVLVFKINSVEERYSLPENGPFHFIFHNKEKETPASVMLYLEANCDVVMKGNMVVTEGDYLLDFEGAGAIRRSYASTTYVHHTQGNVDFWYKPMNANKEGFVNYPATLLESEFLRIATKVVDGKAVYYAELIQQPYGPGIRLDSGVKVKEGWHHLRLTYSFYDQAAYFYVDGVMVKALENLTTLLGIETMAGANPQGDNLFIGTNSDQSSFGEGFIDDLRISDYFNEGDFTSREPLEFLYTPYVSPSQEDTLEISISPACGSLQEEDVSGLRLVLKSRGGDTLMMRQFDTLAEAGQECCFDIPGLTPGAYTLYADMKINGYNYSKVFSFIKDDRPRFIIEEHTPFIISRVESSIQFKVRYDDSYLVRTGESLWAGFALKLDWNLDAVPHEKVIYVMQDFTANDEAGREVWISGDGFGDSWVTLENIAGTLSVNFDGIQSSGEVSWDFRSFYFQGFFDSEDLIFDNLRETNFSSSIPEARLSLAPNTDGVEHKLTIVIGDGENSLSPEMVEDITLGYLVTPRVGGSPVSGVVEINNTGVVELYYDDLLHNMGFGLFDCIVSLRYKGQVYGSADTLLNWEKPELSGDEAAVSSLEQKMEIVDFSLVHLDTLTDTGVFYLEYGVNGIEENIYYTLEIEREEDHSITVPLQDISLSGKLNTLLLRDIDLPEGDFTATVTLSVKSGTFPDLVHVLGYADQSAEVEGCNKEDAPAVYLVQSPDSYISYNNVSFSWTGKLLGKLDESLLYSYDLDGKGETIPSKTRSMDYFRLEEGSHTFEVRAVNGSVSSFISRSVFFVDTKKPEFDSALISMEETFNSDGVLNGVRIKGAPGAITDSSLDALYINGEQVDVAEDGSFGEVKLSLMKIGYNKIELKGVDKVGNVSTYIPRPGFENNLVRLLYPQDMDVVEYAPATLVGSVSPAVNIPLKIYVKDPRMARTSDYTDWKEGHINEDRVFFVEDIYVAPGTSSRIAQTPLEMAVITPCGDVYTMEFTLQAREIIMPIDLTLSRKALAGESNEQEICINARAKMGNISSWSVDFTGDGIYDLVDVVSNPQAEEATSRSWTHMYSSLGLVKPRVRVITCEGKYFAVNGEIIIHEKIKEASHKLISTPLDFSLLRMESGADRVYVLAGSGSGARIEVYEVGRNSSYISDKLFTITDLTGMGITNPLRLKAVDKDNIFVASNRNGSGTIYHIQADEFGIYRIKETSSALVDGYRIRDLDGKAGLLYATLEDHNRVASVEIKEEGIRTEDMRINEITDNNGNTMATPLGIYLTAAADYNGFLAADFLNQRVVRISDTMKALEYFGGFGSGEGQFLTPTLVDTHEDRIFVFDETRKDLQVFNHKYQLLTTLAYDPSVGFENYLDPDFMDDIRGIEVLSRDEGGRQYFYMLMLNGMKNKLAMIRLPQWREMRTGVRNNKMVFLKDREVFTAKPSGSDLKRIISSDARPMIEGTLDWPALSPDGRTIAFTSSKSLYDGSGVTVESRPWSHDNLYTIDAEGENLTRIPLGAFENFEIERPLFSSNGDKIIFSAKAESGLWQIYVYNRVSGGIIRLFESSENARFPHYSPDDRFVVFTSDYDGDEDIEIFDTLNPSIRVEVSKNNARDSLPVWIGTYPGEITDPNTEIESKIAFVSEREGHKGVHYVYIARPSESDVRIVTPDEVEVGDDPDSAALEITGEEEEGDYPAFTGDGRNVVYERFDGNAMGLLNYSLEYEPSFMMNVPEGARKPAGMKNCIAGFKTEVVNGDSARLSWIPYTDEDVFYTVRFMKKNSSDPYTQKKVFSQDGCDIAGLDMNSTYLFQVVIIENEEEAAATQWKEMKMPEVAARPSFLIDEDNPYLVHLSAWKPNENTEWNFTWIIDNQEIPVQSTMEYTYEFGTSGQKIIMLKTSNKSNLKSTVSEPMIVDIVSDIQPVIEYTVSSDASYIDLNARNSKGTKIDWASTVWTITGPGRVPLGPVNGSQTIVPLDGFNHKVNINLMLRRIMVNGQSSTDTLETNVMVDLEFPDVKPVITYREDEGVKGLFYFSGQNSLGNIDWLRALWRIYGDGVELKQENGASTMSYKFPENGNDINYTVTLTVPRANDNMTETTSLQVAVEAREIEPVIDYEILEMKDGDNVTGSKILLSAGNSRGSGIDFNNARWSLPLAGSYSEQPSQVGPTAIFNLTNIDEAAVVEVSLTLSRRGGTDPVTKTEVIKIKGGSVPRVEVIVDPREEVSASGKTIILDASGSTGPDINWEKTTWLIDGQYSRTGPVARYAVPQDTETQRITYVCTLYTYSGSVVTERSELDIQASKIKPFISGEQIGDNVWKLDVYQTQGVGIDWERTMWFIYDGNENVVQKQGASITHAFALKDEAMGYPVVVEMYFKGGGKPFNAMKTIDVAGDEFTPVITWDTDRENKNVVLFSAQDSTGSNIDWSQSKWTFGDSSEAQYGPTAAHQYLVSSKKTSYKVSLTLVRKSANGSQEVKTAYKTIDIAKDEIQPVIKARYMENDYYMILSAEDSEGRGLLLDRSVWIFEGGSDQSSWNYSKGVTTGVTIGREVLSTQLSIALNAGGGGTSSNIHSGAVCRRSIDLINTQQWVTLFVYRPEADGSMSGASITVKINLKDSDVKAGKEVTYTQNGKQ